MVLLLLRTTTFLRLTLRKRRWDPGFGPPIARLPCPFLPNLEQCKHTYSQVLGALQRRSI